MKIINLIKTLVILVILFSCDNILFSQVNVERSKEKVTISGVPYYVHQVKKGETVYSISRAYGLTVEEIIKENPPTVYGISEGQILRIPINPAVEVIPSKPVSYAKERDDTKFIYHKLNAGETVYSLSKYYGVSENEIILSNPGIDINNMSVGAELAVPRRVFMSERQKFDDQEIKYIYHKVLTGESLSSIARKYGLTVRELRRENRDLRFPRAGDFVRVPGGSTEEIPVYEPFITDTADVMVEEPFLKYDRPSGFTPVINLSGTLNVGVLLPLYLKKNGVRTEIDSSKFSKGKRIYKTIDKPEDWIYPPSIDFVEMYEGILLAVDTLRSLGLNINLSVFDIKSDTIEVTKLIMSGRLSEMDLIIGPVYSHNLMIVAAYARDMGIPVVSPVPLFNNSALPNNPTLFMASSSLEIAQRELSKRISEYSDQNIVFIHSDTAGIDQDVRRFKNMIFSVLSYKVPYEAISFKEHFFYNRSMFSNDSINRLGHALSTQSKNIVIIASEDPAVISETIGEIHGLSKKYDIEVFGYPSMTDNERLDPEYFYDLDIMVNSPYWIDYSRNDVKQFNSDFRQKFLTEPVEKSYAWQGYDIAYYFLSGIAIHGRDFISHPEIHNPDLLHTEYVFEKQYAGDGFENQKLYLIRYTKDYEVILIEDNNLNQQY